MPNFISRLSTLRRSLLVSAIALVAVATAVSATSVGTSITTIGITLENGETITNVTDGVVAITSPSTTFSGDTTVTGSDVTIGAAGVKLTGDGDGALTLLGLGDGSDEDLTINLDDTANTIVLSSSTGATRISGLASFGLGTAGVLLTGDGDGAITFLGEGDGSDEDLTINLDDTANTVTFSSSTGVTDLDFSGFRFIIDSPGPTFSGASSRQTVQADAIFSSFTGGYGAGVMGNAVSGTIGAGDSIIGGLIGKYNLADSSPSDHPQGAVIGEIGEDVGTTTLPDGAFVAVLGGDTAAVDAGAAYTVRYLNSTAGSQFNYGLDLSGAAIDSYLAVSYGTADIRLQNAETIDNASNGVVAITSPSTTFSGDITVTGDDVFMTTNTLGALLVGDGTNYNPVVMSGDATIDAAGALTIASNAVQGTDISLASEAAGDIMYANGTDWVRLGIGTALQVLRTNAGATAPEWATMVAALDNASAWTVAQKLDAGITVDTTNFTVDGTTGAVHTAGDFDVATTKFTVASATGNTVVAGTLGVTGATVGSSGLLSLGTIDPATTLDVSANTGRVAGLQLNLVSSGATVTGFRGIDSRVTDTGTAANVVGLQAVATKSSGVSAMELWGTNSIATLSGGAVLNAYGVAGDLTIGTGATITDVQLNSFATAGFFQSFIHTDAVLAKAIDSAVTAVISSNTGRGKSAKGTFGVTSVLNGALSQSTEGASAAYKVMDFNTDANFDYGLDLFYSDSPYSNVFGTADIRLQNGEVISNATDGTISFGAAVLSTTGTVLGNFRSAASADGASVATAPSETCAAGSVGNLLLVDETDLVNAWLWACEQTGGATYAWIKIAP